MVAFAADAPIPEEELLRPNFTTVPERTAEPGVSTEFIPVEATPEEDSGSDYHPGGRQ